MPYISPGDLHDLQIKITQQQRVIHDLNEKLKKISATCRARGINGKIEGIIGDPIILINEIIQSILDIIGSEIKETNKQEISKVLNEILENNDVDD